MSTYYIGHRKYTARESELLCQTEYSDGLPKYKLYRSRKGAYILIHFSDIGKRVAIITEEKARQFMNTFPGGIRRGYYESIFGRPETG